MKKIIITIILLSFINLSYSQGRIKNSTVSRVNNNSLKVYNATEEGKTVGEKEVRKRKETVNYLQLKAISEGDEVTVILPKIDIESIKDETKMNKLKNLLNLKQLADANSFSFILKLGKFGFKIISHSFVLDKSGAEIHYYILEF